MNAFFLFSLFLLPPDTSLEKGIDLQKKGDLPGALLEIRKALEKDPLSVEANRAYMDVMKALGKGEELKKEYEEKLSSHRNVAAYHYFLGRIMFDSFDAAYREFQAALSIDPRYHWAMIGLGTLYLRRGDFLSAIKEYERALHVSPDSFDANFNLGSVYVDMGDFRKAQEHLDRARAKKPESGLLNLSYGRLFQKMKNYEKAEEHLKKALVAGEAMADVHGTLAEIYLERGQKDLAGKHRKEAERLGYSFSEETKRKFSK